MARQEEKFSKKRKRKRKKERDLLVVRMKGGGKVDRELSHYACSEETTGLDAGTAAIDS